uniref:Mos1 transposase HTH domain-containing protein n=1 Tax=Panagrolaimus davidi TaxID=227884 RepID=A0A914PXE2_9BILA
MSTVKCCDKSYKLLLPGDECDENFKNVNLTNGKICYYNLPSDKIHQRVRYKCYDSFYENDNSYSNQNFNTYRDIELVKLKNDLDNDEKNCRKWSNESRNLKHASSTLSLHIASYESGEISKNLNMEIVERPSTDYFEFPRGRTPKSTKPEVMQFKASQKLLNPNSLNKSKGTINKTVSLDPNAPSTKSHFRHAMLLMFHQNAEITGKQMAKQICEIYGKGAISERTCRRWINCFKNGEKDVTDLEDKKRVGHPVVFDNNALREAIDDDPNATVRMLADRLGHGIATVNRHLREIGMVYKMGKWVPHKLTVFNMINRMQIAASLLNRHREGDLPLDQIVTGDEKWCLYENVVRKGQWVLEGSSAAPIPKRDLHPKKRMLSLFWDTEGA